MGFLAGLIMFWLTTVSVSLTSTEDRLYDLEYDSKESEQQRNYNFPFFKNDFNSEISTRTSIVNKADISNVDTVNARALSSQKSKGCCGNCGGNHSNDKTEIQNKQSNEDHIFNLSKAANSIKSNLGNGNAIGREHIDSGRNRHQNESENGEEIRSIDNKNTLGSIDTSIHGKQNQIHYGHICQVGYYLTPLKRCVPCPRGFYQDMIGATFCKVCPVGTTTRTRGTKNRCYCFNQHAGPTRCVRSCLGRLPGDYQSCQGCNVYVSCFGGYIIIDGRECPAHLKWDDNCKRCEYVSSTCDEP